MAYNNSPNFCPTCGCFFPFTVAAIDHHINQHLSALSVLLHRRWAAPGLATTLAAGLYSTETAAAPPRAWENSRAPPQPLPSARDPGIWESFVGRGTGVFIPAVAPPDPAAEYFRSMLQVTGGMFALSTEEGGSSRRTNVHQKGGGAGEEEEEEEEEEEDCAYNLPADLFV